MLDQKKELPADLCTLLRGATLSRQLICVFSEGALALSVPLLADAYGRLDVFAAMQLDERESIRKIGYENIKSWNGNEADDSEQKQAVNDLKMLFPTFLTHIQVLLPNGSDVERLSFGNRVEKPQTRDKRIEKLIADLRAKRTDFTRLQRKFNEISFESESIKATSESRRQALESATNNLKLATQQFHILNEEFEVHVRAAVARELDNKLVPWLKQAQTLEMAVSKSSNGLQDEAKQLLSRQSASDKKFGLRSQLFEESATCQALQLKLREAMAESIQPLPELSVVANKLANRIVEIRRILKNDSDSISEKTPAPALFIEKLNSVRSLDELVSVRKGWVCLAGC
jgi:hypothetical protein